MHILLIEDDSTLGKITALGLQQEGVSKVSLAGTAKCAMRTLRHESVDFVLIDLGLPDMPGNELIRNIRALHPSTPIMVLSARLETDSKIAALDAGADDYLVKPFDLDEVMARIRANQRRAATQPRPELTMGPLSLSNDGNLACLRDRPLDLTKSELVLMRELMRSKGRTLSKPYLNGVLNGNRPTSESHSLEVHIHNLRKKIGKAYILTDYGQGYRMPSEHQWKMQVL